MSGDAPPDPHAVHVTITGPPERAAALADWIRAASGHRAAWHAEVIPGALRIHLEVTLGG